jgi:hypothetical protein
MSNPLTELLPAIWRRRLYVLYALAALVVGALTIGGIDVGKVPDVLGYLGGALGLVAASNTTPPVEVNLGDKGHGSLDLLIVATFVGVLLLLLNVTLR